jgi:predicted MFS family arabinose efflux permease
MAAGVSFFVAGALLSAWMSRIPVVKHHLGLSTSELSIALTGTPVGLLMAMKIIPPVVARRSSAFVLRGAIVLGAVSLSCLGITWNLPSLVLGLVAFGISGGALDITINVQGAAVERAYGRPIMSRLHAMYSIGILLGALVGAASLAAGIGTLSFFIGAAAMLAALGLSAGRSLLDQSADATQSPSPAADVAPKGPRLLKEPRLLAAGVIAFSGLFVEGAVNDWAGVFLRQVRDASFSVAALGSAAFGIGMAIGRLAGDTIIERAGRQRTLPRAALLAAGAMTVALTIPATAAALAGFGVLGLTVATIVPTAFSMAGAMTGLAPAWAMSRLTIIGYLGTFASPAIIGFLAGATGLTAALMLPAILLLLVGPASRRA